MRAGRLSSPAALKTLHTLEVAGQLTLPAPRAHPQRPSPRCLATPVPAPVHMPGQVCDVEGLSVVVVEDGRCGGCRAEQFAFHSTERLQRALTIQAVIAWRLMLMTLLGREVPEYDAELMFTDIELRFLADYATDTALPAPRNLAAAVLLVAILGGYQNRKHDPPPGHQINVARVRTRVHRHPRLSDCREAPGRRGYCPERVVGTGQR